MDATVRDRIKQVLQSPKVRVKFSDEDLREGHAYLHGGPMCEDIWLYLGYWMGAELDYPQIGIMLETPSNAERRADVIRAMREIVADHPDWDGWGFDDPEEAPGIDRLCSLEEFLSKENHVEAIREYFLDCLDELEGLVKTYSILLG